MSKSDCRSQTTPPPVASGRACPQSPTGTLVSLGEAIVLLNKRCAAWLEQLAPVLRELNEALKEMTRQFAPRLRAFEEAIRRPETQALIEGLAEWLALLDSAPSYCLPYDRELARLGIKPLTAEEQRDLMVLAVLLQDRKEVRLGHRLPLAEIALAAGRLDITAALVMARAATQRAIRGLEMNNKREEGELVADAYLELQQSILPSIERRLKGIRIANLRRVARPVLEQVVRDAYLVKSIRRALVRRLDEEAQGKQKEADWDEKTDQQVDKVSYQTWLGRMNEGKLDWDIEQAAASFLERPRASELDRRLVAALRRWPEASGAEIARRLGEPVRTVQYRRSRLTKYVRRQLDS